MTEEGKQKSTLLYQLFITFCVTMGAYSMGIGLGYSADAGVELNGPESMNQTFFLTDTEFMWFSSVINIGALVGGPVGGFTMKVIGRKLTMIVSVCPFLLAWALIGFGNNFATLTTGRVIAGLATGMTTVVVPTFVGEIVSPEHRGLLGTGFQLMVVSGILHAYVFGTFCSWRWLTLAGAIPCCIYLVLVILFLKETPQFLLSKNKYEEAKISLQKYRCTDDVDKELHHMSEVMKIAQETKVSFSELKKPWILKPMLLSGSIMIFQQLTGINAVLFNLTSIFQDAGSDLDEAVCSIIIGAVQLVVTVVAAFIVDKAGRKLLLIISAVFMAISLCALGVYFQLHPHEESKAATDNSLGWLPLVSLVVFITAFSIGYGPIPWVLMGELFDPSVRELAGAISAASNWTTSFIVTLAFDPLKSAIQDSGVYFMFAAICLCNAIFCFFAVYETKGKTIGEILSHYGAPTNDTTSRKSSGVSNPAFDSS